MLFADDRTIWGRGENLLQLLHKISSELGKKKYNIDINKLWLNLSKTKAAAFGNSSLTSQALVHIEGINIERAHHIKSLGARNKM